MKALIYEKAHTLENFAIKLVEVEEPSLREFDVLVKVQAVGINPGETWIRRTRSAEPGGRILLGWEFAGIVVSAASGVTKFKAGDRVFGTGDRHLATQTSATLYTKFIHYDGSLNFKY